jgi:hypothetical protein
MTSLKNQEIDNRNYANKSKIFVMKALMILMIALIFCSCNSLLSRNTTNIYQPLILRLKAKQTILTSDGFYTPDTDEVWHSDYRFRKLERQLTFN